MSGQFRGGICPCQGKSLRQFTGRNGIDTSWSWMAGSRYLLDLAMLPFLINGYESMPDLARVSLQSSLAGCRGSLWMGPLTRRSSMHAYPISTGSSDSTGSWDHRPDHRTGIRTPLDPPNTLQMASAGRLIREKMLNSNIVRGLFDMGWITPQSNNLC